MILDLIYCYKKIESNVDQKRFYAEENEWKISILTLIFAIQKLRNFYFIHNIIFLIDIRAHLTNMFKVKFLKSSSC